MPKEHLWKRDLGINAQLFLERKPQIFRKIVKEVALFEEGELLPKLKGPIDLLEGRFINEDESNQIE